MHSNHQVKMRGRCIRVAQPPLIENIITLVIGSNYYHYRAVAVVSVCPLENYKFVYTSTT